MAEKYILDLVEFLLIDGELFHGSGAAVQEGGLGGAKEV